MKKKQDKKTKSRLWRVLSRLTVPTALLTIPVAIIGWQLRRCVLEKREALREFKQSIVAQRTFNQFLGGETTYFLAHKALINYLEQERVQLEEIRRRHDQFVAIAKTRNANCNAAVVEFEKYFAAKQEVLKLFSMPFLGARPSPAGGCSGSALLASGDEPYNYRKLTEDKFRAETVKKERLGLERISGFFDGLAKVEAEITLEEQKLVAEIEEREVASRILCKRSLLFLGRCFS